MSRVHYGRKSRASGLALQEALQEAGYNGQDINYGLGYSQDALNKPQALAMAVNKRVALETMLGDDVPVPDMYIPLVSGRLQPYVEGQAEGVYPFIGRPDHHSKGRGFWMCRNYEDVQRALRGTRLKQPATHFLQFIEGAREFRVHVVRDGREGLESKYRTIKISEKIGEIDVTANSVRNHDNGIVFNYTDISDRTRRSLRKAARQACKSLALDFGAVDILFKDDKAYVLEVNTAPRLTDETSDTLDKYVQAFMRYWNS